MHGELSELRQFVRNVISEGRADDTRQAFPDIDDATWKHVLRAQPVGSNNKFLRWTASKVSAGEDVNTVISAVQEFERLQGKLKLRDLNQYASAADLIKATLELSKRPVGRSEAKRGATQIYDDGRFLIVRPSTPQSCQLYGAGTKWCVTSNPKDVVWPAEGWDYWNEYHSQGFVLYFLIDRESKERTADSKFAFVFSHDGKLVDLKNAFDRTIRLDYVRSRVGDAVDDMLFSMRANYDASPPAGRPTETGASEETAAYAGSAL